MCCRRPARPARARPRRGRRPGSARRACCEGATRSSPWLAEERVDRLRRHAREHAARDQVRRAAPEAQRVAAGEAHAAVEAEAALVPAEDLEQLLLGLDAQRVGEVLLVEHVHRHEDLALEPLAALHAQQRLVHHVEADAAGGGEQVPEGLVHEVRLHRRPAGRPRAGPSSSSSRTRGGARPRRAARGGGGAARGTAPRAASPRARAGARARRGPAAGAGGAALRGAAAAACGPRAPDLLGDQREQPIEGHRLADEAGGAELLRAAPVGRRGRAAREQQDRDRAELRRSAARSASSTAKPSRFGSSTSSVTGRAAACAPSSRRGLAVVGRMDVVALGPEGPRQDLAVAPVGVDAENPTRHELPPPPSVRIVLPRHPT